MYKKKGLLLLTAVILVGSCSFADSFYDYKWNMLPVSNKQQNAYSAKITDLEKKFKVASDSERYAVGMSLVDEYYSEGYVSAANVIWRSLLSDAIGKPSSIAALKNAIGKKLQSSPNDEFYNLILGNLYERQGLNKDAIACYSRGASINPNNTMTNLACAKFYQSTGEYQKAIKVYDSILMRFPYEAHARAWRAECYLALGMKDKAKAEYENALTIEPANDIAIVGLYNTLKDSTTPSEMVAIFLPQYKSKQITSDVYCELAKKLADNWEVDGAIKYYKLATSMDPKKLTAYVAISNLYKQMGSIEPCKKTLVDAKSNFEKDFDSLDKLNELLVQASSDPVSDAKKLIVTNIVGDDISYYNHITPKTVQVYFNIAEAYMKLENYEQAIIDLNKAAKLDPKNSEIYYKLALSQDLTMQYADAIINIKKAVAIKPENKDYLTLLTKIQPEATNQLIVVALDSINNGDVKKAADIINGLFKDGQQSPKLYFCRGLLRSTMGNNGAALEDLIIANQMDKNDPEINCLLGTVYEMKDTKTALKYYQEIVDNSKDPQRKDVVLAKNRIDELNKIVPVNNLVPAKKLQEAPKKTGSSPTKK